MIDAKLKKLNESIGKTQKIIPKVLFSNILNLLLFGVSKKIIRGNIADNRSNIPKKLKFESWSNPAIPKSISCPKTIAI